MKSIFALSLLWPIFASASSVDDIALVRKLLPAGSDLAQVQVALLQGSSENDAIKIGSSNYLVRDINKDGVNDVLVISEKNPKVVDYNDGKECETYDSARCMIQYGARALNLFYGQRDGSYALAFSNDKMVLNGDEGGVFGDPLEGFSVTSSGAIQMRVYGGSAWRWSFTDVMQYRNGNFFVIGQESYDGYTGDLRSHTKSVNLITGDVVETVQKNADAPVKTKKYKIAVKPLVPVAKYEGQRE